jgi:hypothetical protein
MLITILCVADHGHEPTKDHQSTILRVADHGHEPMKKHQLTRSDTYFQSRQTWISEDCMQLDQQLGIFLHLIFRGNTQAFEKYGEINIRNLNFFFDKISIFYDDLIK